MALGLPQTNILFQSKGSNIIERSARGVVVCILKDDTEGANVKTKNTYNEIEDIDFTQWIQKNFEYLKLIYAGKPSKVIAIRIPTTAENYGEALKMIENLKWNYLTIPGIKTSEATTISAWIKEKREKFQKAFKAVLPNTASDHEGIINFTTDTIKSTIGGVVYTSAEYCARITGILAGLSLARSSTYFVLEDIIEANTPINPDERINKGELIIVFDSEKFKIGRGINSLITFTDEKGEDLRKIKIIEGMDLYQADIREIFEDEYIGKVVNDYDNKQILVAAIGAYHTELMGNVLDKNFDNTVSVDIAAQRQYLEEKGINTSGMDNTAIAKANTNSKVFLTSNIKFVDAMEDLQMKTSM